MAVEAHLPSPFLPQLNGYKEIINGADGNVNVYGATIGYGGTGTGTGTGTPLLSGITSENLVPVYGSGIADSFPAKTTHFKMKADSVVTYAVPDSRKRTRDSMTNNPLVSFPNNQNFDRSAAYTFLGEDISIQIQHQQSEIDHLIAQHNEKVRLGLEERRKRNSRRIIAAVEESIVKRLREKEEEIDRIGKLNWTLEEKVKSLCIENQIWRDLAQSNEATANALRSNLEQALSHVQQDQYQRSGENAAADAESCCGSNYEDEDQKPTFAGNTVQFRNNYSGNNRIDDGATSGLKKIKTKSNINRLCRNCGKVESCVLLLPCRHLCLCTVCGSSLHTCPICKSTKNASVHVNMSCS